MKHNNEIAYSDGNVEDEIVAVLKDAGDLSSKTSISKDKFYSWPFEYHLSSVRANLLRHINFSGKNVLEVGAGMGAISRYLAEECKSLQIVEGTSRRLAGLENRLRGLSNYKIFCGNFDNFETQSLFDVVVVVGVLEYSDLYIQHDEKKSSYEVFLEKIQSLLEPSGVLVLAIENRLGMKYFSGATEDHTGRLFDGILGYKKGKSARTFSKKELGSLLSKSGFSSQMFHYAYPDYKLPTTVVSEKLEEINSTLFCNLVSSGNSRDYTKKREVFFDEGVATSSLGTTGLLGEFANSFLVLAGRAQESIESIFDCSKLAFHYSKDRKAPTQTVFFTKNNVDVRVEKKLTFSQENMIDFGQITWRKCPEQNVFIGENLFIVMKRLLSYKEFTLFEATLKEFLKWVDEKADSEGMLDGEYWDCLPQNIALADEKFSFFDTEWVLKGTFHRDYLLVRFFLVFEEGYASILREKYGNLKNLIQLFFKGEKERFKEFCSIEWRLQISVAESFSVRFKDHKAIVEYYESELSTIV